MLAELVTPSTSYREALVMQELLRGLLEEEGSPAGWHMGSGLQLAVAAAVGRQFIPGTHMSELFLEVCVCMDGVCQQMGYGGGSLPMEDLLFGARLAPQQT